MPPHPHGMDWIHVIHHIIPHGTIVHGTTHPIILIHIHIHVHNYVHIHIELRMTMIQSMNEILTGHLFPFSCNFLENVFRFPFSVFRFVIE